MNNSAYGIPYASDKELGITPLLVERGKTHGDWKTQSAIAFAFHQIIEEHANRLYASQREALDMIATKMSRILAGNANFADHWDDIIGYAKLGKDAHE